MSLMQAPVGIMLLHRTMVQEELARSRHSRPASLPGERHTPMAMVRIAVGRTLVAVGTRLAPHHDHTEPAVGRLSTAR